MWFRLCLFTLKNVERLSPNVKQNTSRKFNRFYGVVVSTLDFESNDTSSNNGRTFFPLSQNLQCSLVHIFSLKIKECLSRKFSENTSKKFNRFFPAVVSTLDFEFKDLSSNLSRTFFSLSQKLQCSFVYVCFL